MVGMLLSNILDAKNHQRTARVKCTLLYLDIFLAVVVLGFLLGGVDHTFSCVLPCTHGRPEVVREIHMWVVQYCRSNRTHKIFATLGTIHIQFVVSKRLPMHTVPEVYVCSRSRAIKTPT